MEPLSRRSPRAKWRVAHRLGLSEVSLQDANQTNFVQIYSRRASNVRCGSLGEVTVHSSDVSFTSHNGLVRDRGQCRRSATTLSAREVRWGFKAMLSALRLSYAVTIEESIAGGAQSAIELF